MANKVYSDLFRLSSSTFINKEWIQAWIIHSRDQYKEENRNQS